MQENYMQTCAPYGTVSPDPWSHMHWTPIKHISGWKYLHHKRKTKTQYIFKIWPHFCLHSTTAHSLLAHTNDMVVWIMVMQMQLAQICIRQQLTDAQMAEKRYTRHLWQKEKLAAILSETVPIWMETTTVHYCDNSSSLGAVGTLCWCSLANIPKAKHIQFIYTRARGVHSCW